MHLARRFREREVIDERTVAPQRLSADAAMTDDEVAGIEFGAEAPQSF